MTPRRCAGTAWPPINRDAGGQNNLGVMYADGRGVPEDDAEAVRWYRLAADQGQSGAQLNLGVMYANGEGVPQCHCSHVV